MWDFIIPSPITGWCPNKGFNAGAYATFLEVKRTTTQHHFVLECDGRWWDDFGYALLMSDAAWWRK